MSRKDEILQGVLSFPIQIAELVSATVEEKETLDEFFKHLFYNFLNEKDTDVISFMDKTSDTFFNQVLYHLFHAQWITLHYKSNYACVRLKKEKLLKWIDEEDLNRLRFNSKLLNKMLPTQSKGKTDLVALNQFINKTTHTVTRKIERTGIIREGFAKAGKLKWQLDTHYIKRYKEEIANNILKGQGPTSKEINYREIVEELLDIYSNSLLSEYCLGDNISDSRGRSIFEAATKAVNPIGSKDIRACIKCKPYKLTKEGKEAIFLAIAELCGNKSNDPVHNILIGFMNYSKRMLPKPEGEDLHVFIWLSRIYDELDKYLLNPDNLWSVPIELDVTSSVLAIMGLLMNDHNYLNLTNLIGYKLEDAWTVDYCSRNHIKKAITPALYGSAASPKKLWDKANLDYDTEQLSKINKEIVMGRYTNAIVFKNHIINNVKPRNKMLVHIHHEKFFIYCNKFNWEAVSQKMYKVFIGDRVERITREVAMMPDLNQFKRYFVTLLIHNLDSQIADDICKGLDFCLPNHDAFIIHPNEVPKLRGVYLNNIRDIYANRKDILRNYFTSIGIVDDWKETDKELSGYDFSSNSLK